MNRSFVSLSIKKFARNIALQSPRQRSRMPTPWPRGGNQEQEAHQLGNRSECRRSSAWRPFPHATPAVFESGLAGIGQVCPYNADITAAILHRQMVARQARVAAP